MERLITHHELRQKLLQEPAGTEELLCDSQLEQLDIQAINDFTERAGRITDDDFFGSL
ncbi:hypothetical protein OMG98_000173 [Salmonella enterica]|nr:hypothetical protein [Salmonella enterica]EDZ2048216.1 hypothetical protein [Salmonella enterica]EEC4527897.1 hypothetical protein [Salmonella enterica]EEC5506576.1 hypothetical protein [Salmonella enterica]EEL6382006.1 hypothetical protein [Salmonella enterica]